jgi:hypothetical protein
VKKVRIVVSIFKNWTRPILPGAMERINAFPGAGIFPPKIGRNLHLQSGFLAHGSFYFSDLPICFLETDSGLTPNCISPQSHKEHEEQKSNF